MNAPQSLYRAKKLPAAAPTHKLTSQQQCDRLKVTHPAALIQRAAADPRSLSYPEVLHLHRTIGNRAVGRLVSGCRIINLSAAVQCQNDVEKKSTNVLPELLKVGIGLLGDEHRPRPSSPTVMRKLSDDNLKELFADVKSEFRLPAATEIERIIAADVDGTFDNLNKPDRTKLAIDLMQKPPPIVWMRQVKQKQEKRPFMAERDPFAISLPAFLGGGRLRFTPAIQYSVFKGRGWISNNLFFQPPQVDVKLDLMAHVILEWTGDDPRQAPNPHFTIRASGTQLKFISGKIAGTGEEMATKEGTESSVAVGLGTNPRAIGANMPHRDKVEQILSPDNIASIKDWLRDSVVTEAQDALVKHDAGPQ
jgi:hypothetical protein